MVPFDLDQSLREIMSGLEGLQAEGREAEADIRKWTEIARKAKDLAGASRPVPEKVAPPTVSAPVSGAPAAAQARAPMPAPAVKPAPAPAPAPGALTCASCNTPLKPTAKFCPRCGTKVERPPAPKPLVCSSCGGAITERTKFCGACGTPVAKTAGKPPST